MKQAWNNQNYRYVWHVSLINVRKVYEEFGVLLQHLEGSSFATAYRIPCRIGHSKPPENKGIGSDHVLGNGVLSDPRN